jgi:hypothetical protein
MTAATEHLAQTDQLTDFVAIASDPRVRQELIRAQMIGIGTTPEQAAERLEIIAGVLRGAGVSLEQRD